MGRVLDTYLTTFGPSLMAAATGQDAMQTPGPGMVQQPAGRQPSGATTFPMEGPGSQSAPSLTFGPVQHRSQAEVQAMQPTATFDSMPGPQQAQSQPTFDPPPPPQQRNDGQGGNRNRMPANEVQSFDDLMSAASDEEINSGIDIIEKQVGGREGMDRAYEQITGAPPDDRLSRKEIGTLLMEFGLRTLAYNDSSEGGLGAVGRAGAETLGMARGMKQEKREGPAREQEQALKNRLLEAQIAKAEQDPTHITNDSQGRLVIVNTAKGTSQVVMDSEGEPITSPEEGRAFASEVDREAYKAAFCEGLTGDAMRKCEQQAIAYSKGGASTLAFPELRRERIAEGVWDFLRDPDNASSQFTIGDETKRLRTMNDDERIQLADRLIEMQMKTITSQTEAGRSNAPPAPSGWQQFEEIGLTEDGARRIREGSRAPLEDESGNIIGYISNRDGRLVRTDPEGNVIE